MGYNMKNSYKLIGVWLDGKPIPQNIPAVYDGVESNFKDKVTLLSDILKLKDEEASYNLYNKTIIIVDYIPKNKYDYITDFYICRLLQIVELFDAKIVCEEKENRIILNDMIIDYYKRKAPNKLLAQSNGALNDMLNISNRINNNITLFDYLQ